MLKYSFLLVFTCYGRFTHSNKCLLTTLFARSFLDYASCHNHELLIRMFTPEAKSLMSVILCLCSDQYRWYGCLQKPFQLNVSRK